MTEEEKEKEKEIERQAEERRKRFRADRYRLPPEELDALYR